MNMEKMVGYVIFYCVFYIVPISVLGFVLYCIFRKIFNYKALLWQDLLFLLPGIMYCSIDAFDLVRPSKTMGSFCMGMLLLALCNVGFFGIRLLLAIKYPRAIKIFFYSLIPLLVILIISIMYFMPDIPE